MPEGTTPTLGAGHIQAAPGYGEVSSELRFDSVSSCSLPFVVKLWVFYFRALRSLVLLSFPQPLNFSSVFPSL